MDHANAIVRNNLHSLGYQYVIIGDGWASGSRSADTQQLQPDAKKFPNGIARLATLIHQLGLKIGITASLGKSCAGTPSSFGVEQVDANTFKEWGIDYVKYETSVCDLPGTTAAADNGEQWESFAAMRDALNHTGASIYYSVNALTSFRPNYCSCNKDRAYSPMSWVSQGHDPRDLSNDWLVGYCMIKDAFGFDHYCDGGSVAAHVYGFLELSKPNFSDPGAWNNMDVMTTCNGNMTINEYKAQFGLWALHQSPMILSVDLRNFNKTARNAASNKYRKYLRTDDELSECESIITNPEVIAVNQDGNKDQGQLKYSSNQVEVYVKPMIDKAAAVVILNKSAQAMNFTLRFSWTGFPKDLPCNVRDLWKRTNIGLYKESVTIELPPSDALLYKVASAF